MIVGIDEVGRGPWAGPLVVGAVILGREIEGITDSKKLSDKKRRELDRVIRENAQAIGLGWVDAGEIDTLGLAGALELACQRALELVDTLGVAYHEIIIDGTVNFLKHTAKGRFVTTMKKADALVPSVGAASIIAKVARDQYMVEQGELYPQYGFKTHVGYGTAIHRAAIEKYGVTPLHRLSFAPLEKYRSAVTSHSAEAQGVQVSDVEKPSRRLTTKLIGDQAETVAASYLESRHHTIIERNWRTKLCEIDIISQKGDTIYFVEVKYRKNDSSGDGLAMVTPRKVQQMQFAAKMYASRRRLHGVNMRLAAIAATGDPPEITEYVEVS